MSHLSDLIKERTKIMVAGDVLKYYYQHQKEEDMKVVEDALEKIKEEEPFYWKILEFIYLNNWSMTKTWVQLKYCSERTMYYKRDRMLLQLYKYVFGGD